MSFNRRMTRPDGTQKFIVEALRKADVEVFIIGEPADLLCFYRGVWKVLECKPVKHKRPRKDQEEQTKFLERTKTPVVKTIHEAFQAVGI